MYILDTNVISELRKVRSGKANKGVIAWAESIPVTSFYISAITVLELETGVLQIERRDEKQGIVLREWLDSHVLTTFADRTLVIDTAVAQCCASLHVPDPRSDRDALIAATALVNDMTVVTRNVSDFEQTKVALLNPWQ